MRSTRRCTRLVLAATLALCAGLAQAQDTKKDKDQPLKGPAVTDRNVPGAAPDFGMGANRRFGERVPPEVFRRALGVLTSDDAPADIRATPEQREKFKEMVDNFESAVRKFRQENAKELAELRKAAGEQPGRGRDADRPRRPRAQREKSMSDMSETENLTPEQQKVRDNARAKLRELQAAAPKIEDVYTKVWAELAAPQRDAVQSELDKWREGQSERRMDEYVKRQGARKNPAPARPNAQRPPGQDQEMMAPAADKPAAQDRRPDAPTDENPRAAARRERLLRLFAQLTPEEQQQLLQRLEERFQSRRRGADRPNRSDPKPEADPDRVNVPKPEPDKK
jgi:hypothetical protein